PEVIFGAGKTPDQVVAIASEILAADGRVLTTRVSPEQARALKKRFSHTVHHEAARCLTLERSPLAKRPGTIAVVAAGTTDLPVAEEAAVTADFMGNTVQRIYDVGVAGLHRLLRRLPEIQSANVVIVVAGMEAALPSVMGGLIGKPLIGVPTSVGYGSHFGGLKIQGGMKVEEVEEAKKKFGPLSYVMSAVNVLLRPPPTISVQIAGRSPLLGTTARAKSVRGSFAPSIASRSVL
ncbi:MAG: nickel pincer cofactor biosynthesis protein LarB, partial [Gammaproteobacteria bacterium]|nr:nickel pincer cofactor biosynthesis protein LarB [Gammaproteobacteria bacterium]